MARLVARLCVLFLVWVCGTMSTDQEIGSMCYGDLQWAPTLITKPYLTFMDNAYCPLWIPRQRKRTRRLQGKTLNLPRGLPLALFCGVCQVGYELPPNITISGKSFGTDIIISNVVVRDNNGYDEHLVNRSYCRVMYALTGRLLNPGKFVCSSDMGLKSPKMTVRYTLTDVPVIRRTVSVTAGSSEQTVTLTCPGSNDLSLFNPIMHVWYHPQNDSIIAASTSSPAVNFIVGTEPFTVACATYNLFRNTKAADTVFTVGRYPERYKSTVSEMISEEWVYNSSSQMKIGFGIVWGLLTFSRIMF